ncbi:unnamed protein product [Thlaspi arvense]|uniref:VQ domain-containing protein n=1 Tax=Thlaspi arvense TaxID=13288 RepID=A0AAU9R6Z9_THLAR|nr:unnamed protein product [Thlaspi arvense]
MSQRSLNDHLRVNKTGKYVRKSTSRQAHVNAKARPHPPQPQPPLETQVYIVHKEDFKRIVQQLTGNQSSEPSPQNLPQPQRTTPEPINWASSVPPKATAVEEYPHALLESLLEASSASNGDQLQQAFGGYQSHMLPQPQVPTQSMPYSNGLEPVMTTTLSSPWLDALPQQLDGAYSLQPAYEIDAQQMAGAYSLLPAYEIDAQQMAGAYSLQPAYEIDAQQMGGAYSVQPAYEIDAQQMGSAYSQQPAYEIGTQQMDGAYSSQPAYEIDTQQMDGAYSVQPAYEIDTQETNGSYSLEPTTVEYPQPLTPNLTFSSMAPPEDFDLSSI